MNERTFLFFDLESQIEATLKNHPSIIRKFQFVFPSKNIIEKIKSFGIKIGITVTSLDEAFLIKKVGADFIIAQGIEAGGHRGVF